MGHSALSDAKSSRVDVGALAYHGVEEAGGIASSMVQLYLVLKHWEAVIKPVGAGSITKTRIKDMASEWLKNRVISDQGLLYCKVE